MKNTLGIHGYTGNPERNDFWKSMKNNLKKDGINLDTPKFSESRITNYSEWEKILDKQDFTNINRVIAHSLGTRVATEYISKNNIHLERLVLVSPTITMKRTNGTSREELENFFPDYEVSDIGNRFENLKNLVKEIIVISSKEDLAVPYEESKKFAEIIGAKFISDYGKGHFNNSEHKELENLIK